MWREKLNDIAQDKDTTRACKLVKGFGGVSLKSNDIQGRQCMGEKSMANAFIQEYAEVSCRETNSYSKRQAVLLAIRNDVT